MVLKEKDSVSEGFIVIVVENGSEFELVKVDAQKRSPGTCCS